MTVYRSSPSVISALIKKSYIMCCTRRKTFMNRIKHLGIASALALASLAISFMSPAHVAGAGNTLCYGLSSKDCQVLTAAEANVSNEKSFQGDFDFTGSVGNTTSNVNVTGKGSAVFS